MMLVMVFAFLSGSVFAQTKTISGKVTSSQDGLGIPGVTIQIKGTTIGAITDIDGNYSINVSPSHKTLVFSYVSMKTTEVAIGTQTKIDVVLDPDVVQIDEVVVTALGISREKKSLGYATQEVEGDALSTVKRDNLINALSGRAAGVQVRGTNNMGGSANIVIRGTKSLTQNNQALFVVDGVPVNNDNTNNAGQISGRSGFDYGNAASDINPDDIESMNILKGAAATALYGSRAANGVIIITTKKGKKQLGGKRAYGVTISSSINTGFLDKSTFPKYQQSYGAGYGTYYYSDTTHPTLGYHPGFEYYYDVDGDGQLDYTVPTYEDASYGEKFDASLMLYQWDAYDPASPNYMKKTPWLAAENGPEYFFQNPMTLNNSVEVAGGSEKSTFRLAYTNFDQKGLMPNSSLKRNNFLFNGSYDVSKDITVTASANYTKTDGLGRNSTGYSDNIVSSFRQWMQVNVDYKMQEELYNKTHRNITWNPNSPFDLAPAYWDNPFWVRNENYETDMRNRIIGFVMVDWRITDHFSLMGRASVDTYDELQEERKAVGSGSGEFGVKRPDVTSGYSRFQKNFSEANYDLMLNYKNQFTEDLSLTAFVGTNIRRSIVDQVYASTDGGLIVPDLYSLSNSVNPMLNPEELYSIIGVNGYFASASLGFMNTFFLDATFRRDISSTLPVDERAYNYPSISGSWIFSNMFESDWLQLGKLRAGYAQVGNGAPFASTKDTYTQNTTFGTTALFSLPSTKNNEELVPERTHSLEAGLELITFNKRLGADLSVYKTNTVNQILPVTISTGTGRSAMFVNAGEIQNKGVELQLFGAPVATKDFRWDVILNWSKNVNEVVSLKDDIKNLQIASLQGGVTINARVGEPYGTIQGTDYVYTNGQKTVGANGYYLRSSTSDKILGNINPDWNAGLSNKFSYKNWAASFLVDWQQGGSVFSLDLYYGMATGLYEETVFTNDLGNPVRNLISEGGGLILEGVFEDGTPNTKRVEGADYRVFGYSRNPNAAFVYDASYVKLREVVLSYSLPSSLVSKVNWIQGATFSVVGSNLWIMYKKLPHADPEASQSSGNVQGWQSGVMPSTRNVGFSINLQF